MKIPTVVNTGNSKKQKEFERIFALYNIPITFKDIDVHEIVATPLEVVIHKASVVGAGVLVEDSSLDLEGHEIGIHIKHRLDVVKQQETIGKKATWTSLMAFVQAGQVYVFEGVTIGTIAPKAGDFEFGFAQYFIPEGNDKTLGQEYKGWSARERCVKNMMEHKIADVMPVMRLFEGYELQL